MFATVEREGRLLSSLGLWAVDVALVEIVNDVVGRVTVNGASDGLRLAEGLPPAGGTRVGISAHRPFRSPPVGPRGSQAVISGGDMLISPQCPVGFD